ncbi:unnamed protein product [Cuscuta epithymum]|uniref:Smr domain-containing protein n=1 Tax=Cuscuta epithymum TaxID=186058 RepID=A0AAV0EVL5_9ASTE|nr:unnamed protein product [Cuscuta epithymum]CAH9127169.1 unnamed protein product [Cuscuta epithymum]
MMMMIGAGIASPPPLKSQIRIPRRRLSKSECQCALSKRGERFLNSLLVASPNEDRLNTLLRKFVASSPRSVALGTLSHLLSPASAAPSHPRLSSLPLPLYLAMSQAPWFSWNSKLAADIIALLHKQKQFDEAETLTAEALSRLSTGGKRELFFFYCHLINPQSKHKSREPVLHCCAKLKLLLHSGPTSLHLKQSVYKSMIQAMCRIGLPSESEKLMDEMRRAGIKLSRFEFRWIVYGYGIRGQFGEMRRMVAQMQRKGFRMDTVTSNMVLSSFGAHGELLEMAAWLQKMEDWGVAVSIRTYNSVLNSCPKLNLLLYDSIKNNEDLPLSLEELVAKLSREEGSLVLILATERKVEWGVELDLHGMHLGTAYVIMLLWFEEVRRRCESGDNDNLPSEIRVVCGVGKHSAIRGKSPVKGLVKKMLQQMGCPLRNDSKNNGCFVAKGRVLKDWMSLYNKSLL